MGAPLRDIMLCVVIALSAQAPLHVLCTFDQDCEHGESFQNAPECILQFWSWIACVTYPGYRGSEVPAALSPLHTCTCAASALEVCRRCAAAYLQQTSTLAAHFQHTCDPTKKYIYPSVSTICLSRIHLSRIDYRSGLGLARFTSLSDTAPPASCCCVYSVCQCALSFESTLRCVGWGVEGCPAPRESRWVAAGTHQ
jgi:hypothetical protein